VHTCCESGVIVKCNDEFFIVLFKTWIRYILFIHLCDCNVIFFWFIRFFPLCYVELFWIFRAVVTNLHRVVNCCKLIFTSCNVIIRLS
jgi:hypothetical protein